ncbi:MULTISPECIES: hypothetical protein [unclassified Kribbella]|uniref:hypothetical protein n=1 Tax=unclassified Kribbella TaxID=2644121 RepID=UPI003015C383
MANEISIVLTRDQALVLFEWLGRTGAAEQPAAFEDQAEQRVLWDLEAALESVLTEPLRDDYQELVETARARLRDSVD